MAEGAVIMKGVAKASSLKELLAKGSVKMPGGAALRKEDSGASTFEPTRTRSSENRGLADFEVKEAGIWRQRRKHLPNLRHNLIKPCPGL